MKKNKLIGLLLLALSFSLFSTSQLLARSLGYYQGSGETYLIFQQMEFYNKLTLSGFIDAEASNDHHKNFDIHMSYDQYRAIFETDRAVNETLADILDEVVTVEARSADGVRQVKMTYDVHNENILLATKQLTLTIENKQITHIDYLVKRKKHVALFITVPGKFESMNVTMPLQKHTDGMGLSGNQTADLGFAVSEEAIIASLTKKSGIAQFCEVKCQ